MHLVSSKGMSSVNKFNDFFDGINTCLVSRKGVVEQLKYAVACGEHLLLEGKPGVAKSYFAHLFLDNIVGAKTFSIACTKKMSEDYLVGPLDMKLFRDKGIMHHLTEGTLIDSDFAFIDEIFDLSAAATRGLLEILNERTFTRGTQYVESPLITCIAATNFSRDDDEEMEAVLDRFMFRSEIKSLTNDKDKLKMLTLDKSLIKIHINDIIDVQDLVDEVIIPREVLKTYVEIIGQIENVTDRTLFKGKRLLQASAALAGRNRCLVSDIPKCELGFIIDGNPTSSTEFAKAMQKYSIVATDIDATVKANIMFNRLSQLSGQMTPLLESSKTTSDQIEAQAREVVTLRYLADNKLSNSTSLRGRIMSHCDKILAQVELIRERELEDA